MINLEIMDFKSVLMIRDVFFLRNGFVKL